MNQSRRNDMFVGDYINGNLYDLPLSSNRKALSLTGGLLDKVVDNNNENDLITLGSGFGAISDLVSRPDGMYVLTLGGDLYRVATLGISGPPPTSLIAATPVPEPSIVPVMAIIAILGRHRPAHRQRVQK